MNAALDWIKNKTDTNNYIQNYLEKEEISLDREKHFKESGFESFGQIMPQ